MALHPPSSGEEWERNGRRDRGKERDGEEEEEEEIALISKKFKVKTPDWTQIKYNLKMFTSETNLPPVI